MSDPAKLQRSPASNFALKKSVLRNERHSRLLDYLIGVPYLWSQCSKKGGTKELSECVCVLKWERNNISWREGKDCRAWTTQVSSQDSVELQELCLFGGERGGFSLTSAAAGLRRGSAWQPRRDRSHSMGHSASSETVAQQQAQHNTGESKARRSALNSCHEHTFD